jgi:hypothetical protein
MWDASISTPVVSRSKTPSRFVQSAISKRLGRAPDPG